MVYKQVDDSSERQFTASKLQRCICVNQHPMVSGIYKVPLSHAVQVLSRPASQTSTPVPGPISSMRGNLPASKIHPLL